MKNYSIEILEQYLEIRGTAIISDWFAGEESIVNRLIADQLSVVTGFVLIKYKPKLFGFKRDKKYEPPTSV